MFYALSALAIKYKFETTKHGQLTGWFNKQFVHEGLIDSSYGKMINKAFNRRLKSDYDPQVNFEKATGILICPPGLLSSFRASAKLKCNAFY